MRKWIGVVAVLVGITMAVDTGWPAAAQDDTRTHTFEIGVMVDYPADWYIRFRSNGIDLASDRATFDAEAPVGEELLIRLSFQTPDILSDIVDAPVTDGKSFTTAVFDYTNAEIVSVGEVTLGQYHYFTTVFVEPNGLKMDASYVTDIDGYIVFLDAYANNNAAWSRYKPTVEAIVASIRTTNESSVPRPDGDSPYIWLDSVAWAIGDDEIGTLRDVLVLDDGTVLIVDTQGELFEIDPATGARLSSQRNQNVRNLSHLALSLPTSPARDLYYKKIIAH